MSGNFSTLISNTPIIDLTAFNFWLFGLPVDAAAESLERRYPNAPRRQILRNWLADNYRIFESLEPFLEEPETFREQGVWPLPPELRAVLVERYYRFEPAIMKEMLGKKLNNRTRKTAEDYCERNRLPGYVGRRTFENLKRITRRVEDLQGDMKEHIEKIFMMPPSMASHYANILFINELRMDTTKKKLGYLKFEDYDYMASVMSRLWTPNIDSGSTTSLDLSWGVLDLNIPQDSRELKGICNGFKSDTMDEIRGRVGAAMTAAYAASGLATVAAAASGPNSSFSVPGTKPSIGVSGSVNVTPPMTASASIAAIPAVDPQGVTGGGAGGGSPSTPAPNAPAVVYPAALVLERSGTTMLDPKSGPNFFKAMMRACLSVGIGLGSAKEIRDLPINILEKVVEPCIGVGWTAVDADFFLAALRDVFTESNLLPQASRTKFQRTWPRLIEGIRLIAERMRTGPSLAVASTPSLALKMPASSSNMAVSASQGQMPPAEKPKRSLFGSTASFTRAILDKVTGGSSSSMV